MSDTPLHDHALLSDAHGAALVTRAGSIDWCCMPRFDRGSCFGRLLDDERGGFCSVEGPDGPFEPRDARYEPRTLVHVATLGAPGGELRVRDALLPGDGPRRLVRVAECTDGRVEVAIRVVARFDYGEVRPWLRVHSAQRAAVIGGDDALVVWTDGNLERVGDHELRATATLSAGERLRLTLTAVHPQDADDAAAAHDAEHADGDLERTIGWWREWAEKVDGDLGADPAVLRSALVLRGLVHDPTGAIIAAPTTSLPESPEGTRTWDYRYAWVRDATFASRALARLGVTDVGDASSRFIMRSAAGHAEEVQVLYGVGGERRIGETELALSGYRGAGPVRAGNAAAGQVQRDANGEILQQCRHRHERGHVFDDDEWRFLAGVVDHVAEHWREPDQGFWEWRGDPRQFVHSKAACRSALDCGVVIAEAQGRDAQLARWRAEREAAQQMVLEQGFDERRGAFLQAIGHPGLDAVALLLPHTGVVGWRDPRMIAAADAVREHLGEDGLVRRYEADDGLPGREGCFLACSFWLAECLARQGRVSEARATFDRSLATASPLGLFAEEHDPGRDRPLGNYPQGLSHLAHVTAAAALREAER